MKQINGQSSQQSSFLLNSRACTVPAPPLHSQASETTNQPLFNYLFNPSSDYTPDEPTNSSEDLSFNASKVGLKIKKNKRLSIQERVKTDVWDVEPDWSVSILNLRRQNHILKQKVVCYEKKMVNLNSIQSQNEYLSKLSFLQQSQIQKLRKMLRQQKYQHVQLSSHNTISWKNPPRHTQSHLYHNIDDFDEGNRIKIVMNHQKTQNGSIGTRSSQTKKKTKTTQPLKLCRQFTNGQTMSPSRGVHQNNSRKNMSKKERTRSKRHSLGEGRGKQNCQSVFLTKK